MTEKTPNWEYLRYNGPSPLAEMPHSGGLSIEDKMAGIWKFGGNWSAQNTTRTGGVTLPVFYIRDRHTPRQVVRAWIHANPRAIESLPKKSLIAVLNRNGSEFSEPIRKLVGRAKGTGLAD